MAIAAVFLIAAVGSASAQPGCVDNTNPGIVYRCGDTVVTSCTFNGNMNQCPAAGAPGLEIGANNIVIDGAGFTIMGSKAPGACDGASETNPAVHSGISSRGGAGYVSYDNVVIKDLVIKDFCTGIALGWAAVQNMDNITVTGCTIYDNGLSNTVTHGMHMCYTNDCNITKNVIHDNNGSGLAGGCSGGGNGIFMYGDWNTQRGWYNEITWNKLYDNTKNGYFMKHQCWYNNISNNTVHGNVEEGGITLRCMMSDFNNITDNNISWNYGLWGLEIGGHNNTIKRNRITNNTGPGIYLDRTSSDYNKIVDNNTIWDNDIGIKIGRDADYNEISNNIICCNPTNDIMNDNPTTFGDYNTCDTSCGTVGYCDDSAGCPPPCVYHCPGSGPDYYVTEKNEMWVAGGYNVTFTVTNTGNINATTNSNTLVKIEDSTGGIVHNQKYPTPALNAIQYPGNSFTKTIGPFNAASAPHKITVCADIDGDVDEYKPGGEDNNCTENVFGAPDLEISYFWWDEDGEVDPYGAGDGLVNDSWKTYYLVYRVKNVGDVATTAPFWMNLSCLDTAAEPVCTTVMKYDAGLNVNEETPNQVAGPFVIGCDNARPNDDWSQVCADYNNTIAENYEHVPGDVQPQWDRCMPGYGGCCDECGDVNCDGLVNIDDINLLNDKVAHPSTTTLDCDWASDVVNCGLVNIGDINRLNEKVSYPSTTTLHCCVC